MNLLRNIKLQRILSFLVLFTALFSQVQTLYACSSMANTPKHVCCCEVDNSLACPMVTSCAMEEETVDSACCELSYDLANDASMMISAISMDYLTLLLNDPHPPPLATNLQQFSPNNLAISRYSLAIDELPLYIHGYATYLLTRRLRI